LVSAFVTALSVVVLFATTCAGAFFGENVGGAVLGALIGLAIMGSVFAGAYQNVASEYSDRAARRRVLWIMIVSVPLSLGAAWLYRSAGRSFTGHERELAVGLCAILVGIIVAIAAGLARPGSQGETHTGPPGGP
jgi:hypothetical protein